MTSIISVFLCQNCLKEFFSRSNLFEHWKMCEQTSVRNVSNLDENSRISPKLNQNEKIILKSVRLEEKREKIRQISPSNVETTGNFPSATNSEFCENFSQFEENLSEENCAPSCLTNLNKLSSFHFYKYSKRERRQFNARLRRLSFRKNCPSSKIHRTRNQSNFVFSGKHFIIDIPTKISSRQRLSSSNNRDFPLIFDNFFSELVKMPKNPVFEPYETQLKTFFNLIHSLASQEFQYFISKHDQQQQTSFTNYSLVNILRQTFVDSNSNFKRTFYQTFQDSDHNSHSEQELTLHSEQDLFIPPLKIRRYDNSSYEIQNRSSSSTTSSASSGISITQIHQNPPNQFSSSDDRRQSETRSNKFLIKSCDQQINSNLSFNSDLEKKDLSNYSIDTNSNQEPMLIDHFSQTIDANSKEINLSASNSFVRKSHSPTVISDLAGVDKNNLPKYQSVALNDGARIRIVNCSNDNSKTNSHRNSIINVNKRSSKGLDENWTSKTGRNSARKASIMAEIGASCQTQPVKLSDSELSHGWLTHAVFYRCHACSHEEFFVVLSRECMNLHISSKHGNMEENFKQRVSNFLNNQGRALKIFQHFLKWQQPWSENEIDQIFQQSNVKARTNGFFFSPDGVSLDFKR